MARFLVPYGLDPRGRLVAPRDAGKGTDYRCPSCLDPLIFKAGPIRVRHFAHDKSGTCSSESVVHRAAKLLIAQRVNEGRPLKAARRCRVCMQIGEQELPADAAQAERRMPSGRVVDVALLRSGRVTTAIEVRVTHAVGFRKAGEMGVPWAEVEGEEILRRPERIQPVKDRLAPFCCGPCEAALQERHAAAVRLAAERGASLPSGLFAVHACYKCGRDLVVGMNPDWINACDRCGARQSDVLLFGSARGPFFGLSRA